MKLGRCLGKILYPENSVNEEQWEGHAWQRRHGFNWPEHACIGPCSSKTISTNGGILLSSWLLFWFGKTHLSRTYLTKKTLQIMTRKIWWYLRCSELFVCKKCFQTNSFFTQLSQCSKVDTVCYSVFTNGSYWGQGVCGIRTSQ